MISNLFKIFSMVVVFASSSSSSIIETVSSNPISVIAPSNSISIPTRLSSSSSRYPQNPNKRTARFGDRLGFFSRNNQAASSSKVQHQNRLKFATENDLTTEQADFKSDLDSDLQKQTRKQEDELHKINSKPIDYSEPFSRSELEWLINNPQVVIDSSTIKSHPDLPLRFRNFKRLSYDVEKNQSAIENRRYKILTTRTHWDRLNLLHSIFEISHSKYKQLKAKLIDLIEKHDEFIHNKGYYKPDYLKNTRIRKPDFMSLNSYEHDISSHLIEPEDQAESVDEQVMENNFRSKNRIDSASLRSKFPDKQSRRATRKFLRKFNKSNNSLSEFTSDSKLIDLLHDFSIGNSIGKPIGNSMRTHQFLPSEIDAIQNDFAQHLKNQYQK